MSQKSSADLDSLNILTSSTTFDETDLDPSTLDLSTLPPLPMIADETSLEDPDTLPSLPIPTPSELSALTNASEQSQTLDDDWDLPLPPFPMYDEYITVGQPRYYSYDDKGELVVTLLERHVTRKQVEESLEWYYTLRKYVGGNMDILQQHTSEDLSRPPTSSQSGVIEKREQAQLTFGMSHIIISETLKSVHSSGCEAFGLPGNEDVRQARNFFAHVFGLPVRNRFWDEGSVVKGLEGKYEKLLGLVGKNVKILEGLLDDEEEWRKPEVLKRRDGACVSGGGGDEVQHTRDEDVREQDEQDEQDTRWMCLRLRLHNPFKVLFRSAMVRWMAVRVEKWLRDMRCEAEQQYGDWGEYSDDELPDEGYMSPGGNAEVMGWGRLEDAACSYDAADAAW